MIKIQQKPFASNVSNLYQYARKDGKLEDRDGNSSGRKARVRPVLVPLRRVDRP